MRFMNITSSLLALLLTLPVGAYEAAAQETETSDMKTYDVTEMDWRARTYVGQRDTVGFDAISSFFSTHMPAVYGAAQSKGLTISGPATGLYWLWDMENMRTSLAAAIPVDQAPDDFKDYEVIRIPEGKALVVDYRGPYEQMMPAHEAISRHIEEHAMGDLTVVVEEYVTDPETEADTSKWHTRIIYVFAD